MDIKTSINKYCRWCLNGNRNKELCGIPDCPLSNIKTKNTKTLYKKIWKKCLECSGNSKEAKTCNIKECPLWIWRKGNKNYNKVFCKKQQKGGI